MQAAIDWARAHGPWDAFVAVGGGSSIDTAKAVNLLLTNPGELIDYVNAPGRAEARAPAHPLHAARRRADDDRAPAPRARRSACSTCWRCKVKTGISHARLRPTLAVVDPLLTMTQPAGVTAAAGMDILCHALESYTARPYTTYDRKQPGAAGALLRREPDRRHVVGAGDDACSPTPSGAAVRDGDDVRRPRRDGAGGDVRRPRLRQRRRAHPARQRLPDRRPGRATSTRPATPATRRWCRTAWRSSLTAPEAFRFTFEAAPRAAPARRPAARPGRRDRRRRRRRSCPTVLIGLMRDIGIPNGVAAVGFGDADVDDLVDGALKQQRLLATAPRAGRPRTTWPTIFRRSA